MTLKHITTCLIAAVLLAATCFCLGMHHAITHMEITTADRGHTAVVTLHENVYIHDLCSYPID